MEKLWFRRKRFGWGWTPATWEGWLSTAIFLGAIYWNARRFGLAAQTGKETKSTEFILESILMVIVFIFVCYKKGEKPVWQWGNSKDTKSNPPSDGTDDK